MHVCMHTCKHTLIRLHLYIYTYIHKYMHTYIHTYLYFICIFAYMHTYINTYMYTCIHAYVRTYIHTYVHTLIRTYVHTSIHTYINATKFCVSSNEVSYIAKTNATLNHKNNDHKLYNVYCFLVSGNPVENSVEQAVRVVQELLVKRLYKNHGEPPVTPQSSATTSDDTRRQTKCWNTLLVKKFNGHNKYEQN